MDCLDLLSLLKTNSNKLKNVKVYGRATREIKAPKALSPGVLVSECYTCIQVDILAINISKSGDIQEKFNLHNSDGIYFVNASMSCFVKRGITFNEWYCFEGDLSLSQRTSSPVIAMYSFVKQPAQSSSKWAIKATKVGTISLSDFDTSGRVYDYLMKSDQLNTVLLPEEVMEFTKCLVDEPDTIIGSSVLSNFQLNNAVEDKSVLESELPSGVCYNEPVQNSEVNRSDILTMNENVRVLSDACDIAYRRRMAYIADLRKRFPLVSNRPSSFICKLFKHIQDSLTSKGNTYAFTGNALLKEYMDSCSFEASSKYMGITVSKYILGIIDEVFDYCLYRKEVTADGKCLRFIKNYFAHPEVVYAGLLSKILGVSWDSLMSLVYSCSKYDISFSKLVNGNPYALVLFSDSFSFTSAEYIAMCLGLSTNPSLSKDRNIGIIYQILSGDTTNSTCFSEYSLSKRQMGITLSRAKYDKLVSFGTYLSQKTQDNIRAYLDVVNADESWKYTGVVWTRLNYSNFYVSTPCGFDFTTALSDFLNAGLGVKFELNNRDWIALARTAEKEVFVYTKVYELMATAPDVKYDDKNKIDALIAEYEENEGIQLESRQRDAVHLISKNVSVITGAAGSGKTTVLKCIVYVIENYNRDASKANKGVSAEGELPVIQFAAPTGKAAKRLQEVIKRDVRTEHSMFMVREDLDPFSKDTSVVVRDVDWYIFDEQSMVTLDLMYQVLMRVGSSRVIFAGDVCQTPPIGKGTPFKNFLAFLPCVTLNVPKRSAEKSGITYNANIINNRSDISTWENLKVTDDFKLHECSDEEIPDVVSTLCKYYINQASDKDLAYLRRTFGENLDTALVQFNPPLTPDDIQVVSPLSKPAYSWGSQTLNRHLQKVFNPKGKAFSVTTAYSKLGTEYRIGDRVIHTSNNYGVRWYKRYTKSGEFTEAWGYGIVNGEVGKIVDIIPAENCIFHDPDYPKPDNYTPSSRPLREDSTHCGKDCYFIVVEYCDFNQDMNYYVLYHVKQVYNADIPSTLSQYTGVDMESLQLFYCGTVHKMQGSQSRLVICVLGSGNFGKFITRNIVYTQASRAVDGEYFIGSVSNRRSSQLSVARTIVADDSVVTIGGLLCK